MCANRFGSYLKKKGGLTIIVSSIRFFPRKKNLFLKLGSFQQLPNSHKLDLKNVNLVLKKIKFALFILKKYIFKIFFGSL
jgi:hypothetical protein